jgi:hypothetical protein
MTMTSFWTSFVEPFGVAPAVIVWFLWTVAIVGLLETLRQDLKLKKAEREQRQWRRASEQYEIRQPSAPAYPRSPPASPG